jgi:uncharacterized protein RhaS with RHS repeats
MYDPTIGQWISEDPIDFDAGDPNLRRYVGNSPTNKTDPFGLQEKQPSVASVNGVRFEGANVNVRIVDIADGKVTIEYTTSDGKTMQATRAIDQFKPADQAFLKKLQLVPRNIVIDAFNRTGAEQDAWVRAVVDGIATLNELPKGKEILQGCRDALDPPRDRRGIPQGIANDTHVRIIPTGATTNTGLPLTRITVSMNPVTGVLDAEFETTIRFNSDSGFAGLGKELWHAWQHLIGAMVAGKDLEKWDLDAVHAVRDVLREQGMELKK